MRLDWNQIRQTTLMIRTLRSKGNTTVNRGNKSGSSTFHLIRNSIRVARTACAYPRR